METNNEILQKWDNLSRTYRKVIANEGFYSLPNGRRLYRIETKGLKGRLFYANGYYLDLKTGKENSVHGMDGATGHGWGGNIIGYATKEEIELYKERNLYKFGK